MTDFVDFMYEQENYIKSKLQSKKHSIKLIDRNSKTLYNKISNQLTELDQTINPIYEQIFIQIDSIWIITVKLMVQQHTLIFSFQILRNSEILRVQNAFTKNYLTNLFTKQNNSIIQPKINPMSGEISLQISSFQSNDNLKNQYQYKQKIQELNFVKTKIFSICKNIISVSEGDYGFQNNLLGRDKTNQMKMYSILSTIQNQSENIHNIKNIIIENQKQKFNNINFNKQQKNYLLTRKAQQNKINFEYRKNMQYILKQKKNLYYNTIRPKISYSNLQTLNLSQKQRIMVSQQIKSTKFSQMIKINDINYGKLFLNYQNINLQRQQHIISNIQMFDHKHQYNFLNYYFVFQQNQKKYLFKMALKKLTLHQYLQKNINCLSFENKLKIFLQIYFAIQTIWQKYKIFIGYFNVMNISITKTLIIKLQISQNWLKIGQNTQQISDYQRFFYKSQTMIRLNKIFNNIFLNKNIYCFRPIKKQQSKSIIKNDKNSFIIRNKINQKLNYLDKYGFKEILSTLSYSMEKYYNFNSIQQINQDFLDDMINLKRKYMQGNLDLILGILFKSFQLIKLTQ